MLSQLMFNVSTRLKITSRPISLPFIFNYFDVLRNPPLMHISKIIATNLSFGSDYADSIKTGPKSTS